MHSPLESVGINRTPTSEGDRLHFGHRHELCTSSRLGIHDDTCVYVQPLQYAPESESLGNGLESCLY
jgi:hypothetical protein